MSGVELSIHDGPSCGVSESEFPRPDGTGRDALRPVARSRRTSRTTRPGAVEARPRVLFCSICTCEI